MSGWSKPNSSISASTRFLSHSPLYNLSYATTTFLNQIQLFQCLLAVLEGKEADQRHLDQLHDNEAFEDDEGIAESGM